MKPNASLHNPDPAYLRALIRHAELTQEQAASALGISPRLLRYYLSTDSKSHQDAPYCVQYAIEGLAGRHAVTLARAS